MRWWWLIVFAIGCGRTNRPAACAAGYADCDGISDNGCEVDITSDPNNCGGCGVADSHYLCTGAPNVNTPTCIAGVCAGTCADATLDCDGDKSVGGGGCECGGDPCQIPQCNGAACTMVNYAACYDPVCGLSPPVGCAAAWADSDGDGLSDAWEIAGCVDMNCNGSCADAGVDIPLPGANPAVKDLYIQYDFMNATTTSSIGTPPHCHQPPQAALDQVTQAFAAHGITLHWIAPATYVPGDVNCASGSIAEHLVTTRDSSPAAACVGSDFVTMQSLRSAAFGGFAAELGPYLRHPAYHYLVFAHNAVLPDTATDGTACPQDAECLAYPDPTSTGSADIGGDDIIVALGYDVDVGNRIGIETWSGTTMHEIGHNLGLKHGSLAAQAPQTCISSKPNFISVMSYLYQSGISVAATAGTTINISCATEADCLTSAGACSTPHACHCTDDLVANVCYRVDYSDTTLLDLDEASLNENVGVGGPVTDQDIVRYCAVGAGCTLVGASNGSPIDWNNRNGIENPASGDIDGDNGVANTSLRTTSDWDKIQLSFQCSAAWGAGAPADDPSTGTTEAGAARTPASESVCTGS